METIHPTDRRAPRGETRSFTLIELLVVISIIVILSGGLMLSFQRIFSTTVLESATNKIIALIRTARELTYTQKTPHMVVINGGDNTVTLYSAGNDGHFAIGAVNQDDAKDDVVVDTIDLDSLSTNNRIVIIKALTDYTEDSLLGKKGKTAEPLSGVFIFTTKGVRYGTRPGDAADDEAIITIGDSTLRTSSDAWESNTTGDIILYLLSEVDEQIMIRVGPVRGYAETKIKVATDES